jgi:hypothetical protein
VKNTLGLIGIFSLTLAIIFLVNGCKKDPEVEPLPPKDIIDTTQGRIFLVLDDASVDNFHAYAVIIDGKLSLGGGQLRSFHGDLVSSQNIGFALTQKSFVRQTIHKMPYSINRFSDSTSTWAYFGTSQDDGDVGCEFFEVDETDSLNNYIQITRMKNDFSEIWGTFNVSFVKVQDCSHRLHSQHLTARYGYFHVFVK